MVAMILNRQVVIGCVVCSFPNQYFHHHQPKLLSLWISIVPMGRKVLNTIQQFDCWSWRDVQKEGNWSWEPVKINLIPRHMGEILTSRSKVFPCSICQSLSYCLTKSSLKAWIVDPQGTSIKQKSNEWFSCNNLFKSSDFIVRNFA